MGGGLHNLYFPPNFIRMIKLMMMRCAGHVACMEEACEYKVSVQKLKERDHLEREGWVGYVYWSHLIQDRWLQWPPVNMVMHLRIP
jgi:hypothetical protein